MKKHLLLICLILGTIISAQGQDVADINHYVHASFDEDGSTYTAPTATNFGTHCSQRGNFTISTSQSIPGESVLSFLIVTPSNDTVEISSIYPDHASYYFGESGTYQVAFVTSNLTFYEIDIVNPNPTFTINPNPVFEGQPLTVDYPFSDPFSQIHWDMGDGNEFIDSTNFEHIYSPDGTYEIELKLEFGECSDSAYQSITVLPNDPTIVASDLSPCEYDTITLSASCPYEPAVQQWQWHYQGNVVGNQQNLNWFLATDDPQTLTLTTYDADNNVLDQSQYTINGITQAPDLPIINGPALSCQQREYHLSEVDSQYTYQWQVQNGQIVAMDGYQITILWQGNDGALSVLVTDPSSGCQNTATLDLEACCPQEATADFVLQDGQFSQDLVTLNNNSSTVANKTLVIYGEFTVYDPGISLQNCQVYMAPHSAIKVLTNYNFGSQEFTAYQTDFTSCMDTMWQGIQAREGKLTLDDCLVENAQKGVEILGSDVVTYGIRNTTFKNNHTHFSQTHSANNDSYLYGNSFTSFGGLLPPHSDLARTRIGVELIETDGVVIGGQADHPNSFHGADFGVFAVDANATVSHNQFNQLVAPNPLQLIDLHGFSLFNSVGIFAGRTSKHLFHLSATHNDLWSNRCGIYSLGYELFATHNTIQHHKIGVNAIYSPTTIQSCNIANNTIANTGTAISSYANMGAFYCTHNDISHSTYGIRTTYSSGHEFIQNNCLQYSKHGIHLSHLEDAQLSKNFFYDTQASGISMANTKNVAIMHNRIMGQSINEPQSAGIHAYDCLGSQINQNEIENFERCTYFSHNNQHTKLTNNLFYNGQFGVYLANKGVIGPQGSETHPQDNRWPTTQWTDLYHTHLYCDTTTNGTFSPFYYRCSGFYFMPETSVGDPEMPTIVVPSAGLPPVVYASTPGNCSGALGNGTAQAIDEVVEIGLNALDAQALSMAYEPQRYGYQQALTHELSRRPDLVAQRPDLNDYLQTAKSSPLYHREEARQLAGDEDYPAARQKLDQWAESHAIATTTKAVWKLIYQLQENTLPPTNATPQEQDSIRAWASLCPYTHGTAVYMARSLARQIDTAWVDYTHDCERSNPIMGARLAQSKGLSIYPNPSSGHFRIEGQGVELVVYDLLGRERYRAPLNGRHSLFIHDWPQGIYMVKTLNSQGQPLATQKLIKTN